MGRNGSDNTAHREEVPTFVKDVLPVKVDVEGHDLGQVLRHGAVNLENPGRGPRYGQKESEKARAEWCGYRWG